jgi:hypothetical protein
VLLRPQKILSPEKYVWDPKNTKICAHSKFFEMALKDGFIKKLQAKNYANILSLIFLKHFSEHL